MLRGNTTAVIEEFGVLRKNKRFFRHVISQAVSQGYLHVGSGNEVFREQWSRSSKPLSSVV